jgi:hypothetical protein
LKAIGAAALVALPYAPFVAGIQVGHGLVGALLVCAATLGAPGAAGMLWPGGPGAPRLFVRAIAAVSALNIGAAAVLHVLGVPPTPQSFGAALAVGAAGLAAAGALRGGRFPSPRANAAAWLVAAVTFGLAFFSGTRVVPPLEDQDMEVQGTAYGLAHDLQPLCATNRNTLYWFAHPLLHHAFSASTLIFAGQLETVRPPYDLAKRLLAREGAARQRGFAAVVDAFRNPRLDESRDWSWVEAVYEPFLANPALFGTRAANFAMSAATAVLVFAWLGSLGIRTRDALLVTCAYVTLPEVFVRSGYGGYYAITTALFTAGAWLAGGAAGGGRSGFVAGFLGALANQKTAILVAAVGLQRVLTAAGRPWWSGWAHPAGALAGVVVFWTYGLALFPMDFVVDHLLEHAAYRFDGAEVVEGTVITYPTRAELWIEFGSHMGWIWTVLAALGTAAALPQVRRPLGATVLLVFVGYAAFTFIDWRQTKHLCNLLPAMSVLIGALFLRGGRLGTAALRLALAVSLAWNLGWIGRLVRDFDSLTMSTIW